MPFRNKIRFSIAIKLSLVFFSVFVFAIGDHLRGRGAAAAEPAHRPETAQSRRLRLAVFRELSAGSQSGRLTHLSGSADPAVRRARRRPHPGDRFLGQPAFGFAHGPGLRIWRLQHRQRGHRSTALTCDHMSSISATAALPWRRCRCHKSNKIVAAIVVSSSMSDVESAVSLVQWLMADRGRLGDL